ncbi:MAG TPA: HK97 family phage prohead protease [Chryseosolibacter sp.]|nr:HK97 family phage prohead protease [Chryseosolibacter sp.]
MIEKRSITIDNTDSEIETRSEVAADGKRFIMGYFALNNSNSVKITEKINGNIVTFTERIAPEAFTETDFSDVIYTVEHSFSRPIARTNANLQLKVTDRGLFARAEIPSEADATTEQNDLIKYVNQKIIRSNSFAFKVGADSWEKRGGELYRTISKITKVVDLTSTVQPAYPETFVFSRSLDENAIKEIEDESSKNEIKEPDTVTPSIDFDFQMMKKRILE